MISGNQEYLDNDPIEGWGLKPKWTPTGKIRVYDGMQQQLEIQGVKVRATKLLVIKTDYTDASGDYTLDEIRGDVNFSIKWETTQYDIRDRFGVQAMHNGPNQNVNWDLDIVSGKTIGFATLHRVAYRYHYKDRGGLITPKPIFRLNIKYVHQIASGTLGINFGNNWSLSFFNNIKVWGLESNGRIDTGQMFNTIIHELAYSSHIKKVNNPFALGAVDPIIRESWAECVGQFITKIEYDDLGFVNFDEGINNQFIFNLQLNWDNTSFFVDYSPLFIDIFDNYNQFYRNSLNCAMGSGSLRSDVCYAGTPPSGTTAN